MKNIKQAFKFKPKLNELQQSIIEELSYHTTKLYNIANHDCLKNGFQSYVDMNKNYSSNWHKEYLHSHNYQHCLRVLEKNWKAFFHSSEDYKKHPYKYNGQPCPPKYKNHNNKKNEIIFTKAGIRFRNNALMLSLSKLMQQKYGVTSLNFEVCDKLQSLFRWDAIQQVKIKWDNSSKQWYLIIIYVKEEQKLPECFNNIMAIDLGLDNLATITFLQNEEIYLINGRPLKSVNSYINKRIAYLQSIAMHMTGSKKHRDTKAITNLRRYRDNYIHNYLHKASKRVIELAIKHQCNTIVIGDMEGIKQENTNKTFIQIPIQHFREIIKYKAELRGITVVFQKEAYTSGCSALDLEPISKKYYNKKRRTQRGLFKSNYGFINADVNGSLNILRLYTKDTCIPKLITLVRDKGYVISPVKQRVA